MKMNISQLFRKILLKTKTADKVRNTSNILTVKLKEKKHVFNYCILFLFNYGKYLIHYISIPFHKNVTIL